MRFIPNANIIRRLKRGLTSDFAFLHFLSNRLVSLYAMTSQGYARIEDIPEGRGVTPALDDLEAGYDESLLPRIREENGLRYGGWVVVVVYIFAFT